MTIAEVKQEKVKLQNKIGDLLKEFNRKTGMEVMDLSVNMAYYTTGTVESYAIEAVVKL